MIQKKKLRKSKGKWVVALYSVLILGAAVAGETVLAEGSTGVTTSTEANLSTDQPLAAPNINHLQGATATASNVEAGTNFDGAKAIDGQDNTRWATDRDAATPTLTATLPQTTHIERVEIKWDQRLKDGQPDPNVNEWRLSYATEEAPDSWTVAHTRTGQPAVEESVNLEQGVDAKKLKLEVTNYVAGRLGWRNVAVNEFRAFSNKIIKASDVNHLQGATATASNVEAGQPFTADKAVDGQETTHWATDVNAPRPTLTLTLPHDTHIERVEIDWDKRANSRLNVAADPNVRAWRLSYATSDAVNATEDTRQWQVAHERPSATPLTEEVINLSTPVTAKYLKLEVLESVAGQLNWNNVGVREIRAYSNPSTQAQPTNLNQIDSLSLNADQTQLLLPERLTGVELIGSDKQGVIDLTGRVYQPLTAQTVKVMLKQTQGTNVITKEFEVSVPGRFTDEGVGEKPTVVPVVQQWHGVEGKTSITANTVIVADDENFARAAELYREDLAARGLALSLGNSTAEQRITFRKVSDKGYGQEGYGITIDNGVITIEADSHTGAFYATRTLLQMGETDLQNGEIRDFPSFSHRGFLLDTGRKFVPFNVVVEMMKNMAYYKMNDLQLHLNDNYIFLKKHIEGKNLTREQELEYVLNNASTGFRAEIDVVGANGVRLTSEEHYTKEQLRELARLAADLGINLVPEIDTPGHALSFVKVRPDLMYQGAELHRGKHNVERVAMLDLGEKYDETLAFVKSVYEKLYFADDAPLKDVKTIHIGTDEYYGDGSHYRRYLAEMLDYIKSKGKTPRFWGSLSFMSGNQAIDGRGTELQVWNVGWHRPELALSMGAKVINITDSPTYSVPSGNGSVGGYGDYAGYPTMYNRWTPNDFRTGGGPNYAASHPQIIGGGHAVWNDNIDLHETGITSYDVFKRFFATMTVAADKTWGSPRLARTYAERQVLPEQRTYAPNTNPEYRTAETLTIDRNSLDRLTTNNVSQTENGLAFDATTSYLMTGLGHVGPDAVLTMEVTLTGDGVQSIVTDGKHAIYLSDKDGKLAYQFEHLHIQFDKTLEKNRRYKLTFVTKELKTDVYVDDVKLTRLPQAAHPALAHTTFVLPMQTVAGFTGVLHRLELSRDEYISPFVVGRSEIAELTTNSQDTEHGGQIEKAFDGNPSTLWHSHWTNKQATYTVDITFKQPTALQGLTYTPRQTGTNGNILRYELYAKQDGQLTKVADGTWANDATAKVATFSPMTTDHIQLKVLQGAGGFASASELTLMKVPPITERRETRLRRVPVEIDFTIERTEDPNLDKGKEEVDQEGVKGRRVDIYEDIYVNDVLETEGTTPVRSEEEEPARPQKVRVGTKEVTPPPADGTDAGNDGNTGNQDTGTDQDTDGDNTDNSGHSGNDTNTGGTDNQTDGGQDSGDGSGNTDTGNNTGDGQETDNGTGQGDQSETAPQPPADGDNPDVIDTPDTPTQPEQPDTPKPTVPETPPTTDTPEQPETLKPSEVVHQPTGVKVKVTSSQNADIAAKIAGTSVAHKETGDAETPEVLKGKDFDIFDIELVDKDGQPLDWTGEAKVTLPIDAGKEVAEVFYLPENGQPEQLDFETKEVTDASGKTSKVVTFTANHFSQYGIVYKSATVPTPSTPITPPTVIIDNSGVVDKGDQGTGTTDKTNTTTPVVTPVAAAPTSTVASSKPSLPATGDADSAIAVLGTVALISALGLAGVRRKGD